MESDDAALRPTAHEAAAQLEAVSDVRRRMQADPSRRALAVYGAWSAVALAAYWLVFLLAWPGRPGTYIQGLLTLTLLVFITLAHGALAARGARFRPTGSEWVIVAAVGVIVLASIVAGMVIDLPLYARLGIPVLILLVQGLPALAVLRRTAPLVVVEPRRPLSTGVRATTLGIGLGVAAAVVMAVCAWRPGAGLPVAAGRAGR